MHTDFHRDNVSNSLSQEVCLHVTINPFAVVADGKQGEHKVGAGSRTPSGQVSAICMLQYADKRLSHWKTTREWPAWMTF